MPCPRGGPLAQARYVVAHCRPKLRIGRSGPVGARFIQIAFADIQDTGGDFYIAVFNRVVEGQASRREVLFEYQSHSHPPVNDARSCREWLSKLESLERIKDRFFYFLSPLAEHLFNLLVEAACIFVIVKDRRKLLKLTTLRGRRPQPEYLE